MSRYIDADDALELLNLMYDNQEDKDDPYNVGVMGAINYIKHKAPSIDIVRCRECKYWQPHEQHGYDEDNDEYHDYCGLLVPDDDYYAFMRTADDFCSYGEREGE